ncbi:MAG: hypothetical protein EXR86_01290 [Gammaproteobacteria bacterium]|nr:hypothetical protein [Gammaproteobacteria bacterium]
MWATRRAAAPLDLASAEIATIERALRESGGNVRRAATLLGLSRSSLYRRLAKLRDAPSTTWCRFLLAHSIQPARVFRIDLIILRTLS